MYAFLMKENLSIVFMNKIMIKTEQRNQTKYKTTVILKRTSNLVQITRNIKVWLKSPGELQTSRSIVPLKL